MFRVVTLQALLTAVVSAGAWLLSGRAAAISAALGGAACVLPSAGFALWLGLAGRFAQRLRAQGAGPGLQLGAVFVGEFAKVLASIGLMVLIAVLYKGLVWLALIIAVSVVSLLQAAAPALRRA